MKLFGCDKQSIDFDIYLKNLKDIKPLDLEDIPKTCKRDLENTQIYDDDDDDCDREIIDFQFEYGNLKREQSKFYRIFF